MFAQELEAAFHRRFSDTMLAIDSHVGGEPARLIVNVAPLPGRTTNDKRLYLAGHRDEIRLLLTREPRGHRDMFASVLTGPESDGAAFGLVYMDARRYPYLCGHATMAAVSALIELELIEARPPQTEVVVDTPSGPWRTVARLRQETEAGVSRRMVESVAIRPEVAFAYLLDRPLQVPGLGTIRVDVACTGGFFVMVSAPQIGLELSLDNAPRLTELGMAIIEAGNAQLQVQHPRRPYVNTIDVVEFFDPGGHAAGRGKNFVVLGEGHIDRSPCGTGTCAKLALLYQRGELAVGQPFINEGLLGTTFEARIIRETTVGHLPAIIPEVSGTAYLTGLHHFVVAPGDPLSQGFLL